MGQAEAIMARFRALTKAYTAEALRDLLNQTVLAHDPVCVATVAKWKSGDTSAPRGERFVAVQNFCNSRKQLLRQRRQKTTSVPKTTNR